MRKIIKELVFFLNVTLLTITLLMFITSFIGCLWEDSFLKLSYRVEGFVGFILSIKALRITYKDFFTVNRKKMKCKPFTDNELEMIEDAKNLIKKVDEKIEIADFNVYKVGFSNCDWFDYDKDTGELSVFISLKWLLKRGKNVCFLAIVHEILHSQNLKDNLMIFDNRFLEGLNQLLIEWLIQNYSEKYEIPKIQHIASIKFSHNKSLEVDSEYNDNRQKDKKVVQDILQEAEVDLKEVFLHYIDFQPEFFNFVPKKYLK